MKIALWVTIGSGLGGMARVAVASLMLSLFGTEFPFGILAVNVSGSFLIGLAAAASMPGSRLLIGPSARQFLLGGFCGGFTTFSFFSLQTMQLLDDDRLPAALLYSGLTLVGGMLAVWIGYRYAQVRRKRG